MQVPDYKTTCNFTYSTASKKLRRQAKAIFSWYTKEREDPRMIYGQKNTLTDGKLVVLRGFLKFSKHAFLYIQKELLLDLRYWTMYKLLGNNF